MRTKVLTYLVFCFLGIFCAEVVSANQPGAPLFPPAYLMYGVLHVLVLDLLLRKQVRSWATVYLLGVGVGYCIESFVGKLAWFGGPTNQLNPLGVLPLPDFPVLIFFFHPLMTVLIPVFLARRYLGFPLALPLPGPWADRLLWLWPLMPAFQRVAFPRPPGPQVVLPVIEGVVWFGLLAWLRRGAACPDLSLGEGWRRGVVILTVLSMAVWTRVMPASGHGLVLLPGPRHLVFAALFLALVAWVIRGRLRNLPEEPAAFDPAEIPLGRLARFGAYFLVLQFVSIVIVERLPRSAVAGPWILGLLACAALGTVLFLRLVGRTPGLATSSPGSGTSAGRPVDPGSSPS